MVYGFRPEETLSNKCTLEIKFDTREKTAITYHLRNWFDLKEAFSA